MLIFKVNQVYTQKLLEQHTEEILVNGVWRWKEHTNIQTYLRAFIGGTKIVIAVLNMTLVTLDVKMYGLKDGGHYDVAMLGGWCICQSDALAHKHHPGL